jgi:hypothetical protein
VADLETLDKGVAQGLVSDSFVCPLLLVSLAGTPVQNNMVELFGLLSFMYPDIFTAIGPFEAAFNLTKGQVSADLAV